jgi:putative ABC transport system substrate-binding protein
VFGSVSAQAQQPKAIQRIGYVGAGSLATAGHHAQAFAQGLRELGYVEGQNIAIDHRWAEGKLESLHPPIRYPVLCG